jgi:hypothetical protein
MWLTSPQDGAPGFRRKLRHPRNAAHVQPKGQTRKQGLADPMLIVGSLRDLYGGIEMSFGPSNIMMSRGQQAQRLIGMRHRWEVLRLQS